MPKSSKRQKVKGIHDIALQAWEHYRNYIDSLADDTNDGDRDELDELLELSKGHVTKNSEAKKLNSVESLLPILVSVAYYHLAESAIAEYLQGDMDFHLVQSLLMESLEYYPENAATWSMGANFGRMTHRLSLSTARQWYERAAEYSSKLREESLRLLVEEEDNLVKEWIELLLLNQVVGVEFEVDDVVEATTNQEEIEEDQYNDNDEENEDAEGQYSASAVEGTSRFMCAMLSSMEGKHDKVVTHLQQLGFTHRLHPNIWKPALMNPTSQVPQRPPLMFCPEDGILPHSLYQSMKQVFAPNAAYWTESDYIGRGYYSYFMDYDATRPPRNVVEDVIVNHLLPRAKQVLSEEEGNSICGFEWWTHTRPIQANLGHNLHFDTDEALLAQEKKITHPILSSVLYLTGGSSGKESPSPGGATIVLDQTPDATDVASHCWQGIPVDNAFLLFPGNLLHGVLPCRGTSADDPIEEDGNMEISKLWKNWKSPPNPDSKQPSRLTFMVGFWTRNVPATMKERHLYGPCGPLPPATGEHSWVQEINQGYDDDSSPMPKVPLSQLTPSPLPKVSPAWESIATLERTGEDYQELNVPRSIDHRFFVKGAPRCFYDSLFEEDSEDPCV